MTESTLPAGHRSGYVAIVGQPNVGKSTLLNAMLQYKLAIVSSKPQTTRNRIVGIRTDAQSQLVFLDTPGIHRPTKELNRALLEVVRRSFEGMDLILHLVDSEETRWNDQEEFTLEVLSQSKAPRILVPNKIDLVRKESLLPLIARYQERVKFEAAVPVSALTGDGVEALIEVLIKHVPEGPRYYPEDQLSESSERDIVAESIRERIFHLCHKEIPYSTAVQVEQFEEVPEKQLTRIHATIFVEKDSQKSIVIGKGGQMLRQIGTEARAEIERFLGTRVFLELFVRVEKNWTRNPRILRELGLMEK